MDGYRYNDGDINKFREGLCEEDRCERFDQRAAVPNRGARPGNLPEHHPTPHPSRLLAGADHFLDLLISVTAMWVSV